MSNKFPVTITTLEELRLLEQEARARSCQSGNPRS